MRCPDCSKFVAFDEPNTDNITVEFDDYTLTLSGELILPCAECGTDLKSASLEASEDVEDHFPEIENEDADNIVIEYEMTSDPDISPTDRLENKDRHGKTINNYRYMKHYYGVEATATIKRTVKHKSKVISEDEADVSISAEEQASGFDELV